MSIRDLAWDVGALIAALVIGVGVGYVRGDAHGVESMNLKVLSAQQAKAQAENETAASKEALVQVQGKLVQQRQDMQAASARAADALKARDGLATQLATETRQRIDHDRKTLHEHDCAALDHLPVCPRLARRLFGQPVQGATGAAPAGH